MKHLVILLCVFSFYANAKNTNPPSNDYYFDGWIENRGQFHDQNNNPNLSIKYLWNGNGLKVALKENSFSYELFTRIKDNDRKIYSNKKNGKFCRFYQKMDSGGWKSHRIDVEFINANLKPDIIPQNKSEDYLNYYTIGTSADNATKIHYYKEITYKNIYPNIDIVFMADDNNRNSVKYNFIVRPGGNPSLIRMRYKGADSMKQQDGNIKVFTSTGKLEERIPHSYLAENNLVVNVKYNLSNNEMGFVVSDYDIQKTLIIDPWATYYGGNNVESGTGITADTNSNVISVLTTNSIQNISSIGAYQTIYGGMGDGCVVKFNSLGQRIWATYFGGTDWEAAYGVACDNRGNIIITGVTESLSNIASIGAYQGIFGGQEDVFLVKFSSDGLRKWSTYYGGQGGDFGYTIAVDKNDNIVIAGETSSQNSIASAGAFQSQFGGGSQDGFLAKFDSTGNRMWGTYYGGDENALHILERIWGVCTDTLNNIIVAGATNAPNNIASTNAYQNMVADTFGDAFIAKFNAAGVREWGTYYGGEGYEESYNVATDKSNNILFVGETSSLTGIATPGAHKTTINAGDADAFLVKFSPQGMRLWGTYYGGAGADRGYGVSAGDSNIIVLCGETGSKIDGIATPDGYQTIYGGSLLDAFIAKLDSNGVRHWGTYFGGAGDEDIATSTHVSASGNILVTGSTNSPSGISTSNAFQTAIDSVNMYDAFIASFSNSGQLSTAVPSLNNPARNSLLHVYPNPTKEQITVSIKDYTNQAATLSIQDVGGKLLQTQAVHSSINTLHLKDLPAGVYLLQYDDGEVCETLKIVKE